MPRVAAGVAGPIVELDLRTLIAEAQRDFEAKRHIGKPVLMVPPAD